MREAYFVLAFFWGLGAFIAIAALVLGWLLGPSSARSKAKQAPYECGFDAVGDARMPFDVRFYLIAILFIVFDLEIAILYPFAVVFRDLSPWAWAGVAAFLLSLTMGFIYEWQKGALEWE